MNCLIFLGLLTFLSFSDIGHAQNLRRTGPYVNASKGEPWPLPQQVIRYERNFMVVRPSVFRFEVGINTCDIVEQALKRYYSIILKSQSESIQKAFGKTDNNKTWKGYQGYRGYLDVLFIDLVTPCESMPHEEMDESYSIRIDSPELPNNGILSAKTNWGILRGLETFSQLLHFTDDYGALQIKSTTIKDYPRFSFRSVLLDSSRHFLSKKVILQNLDIMAMNKMNVFHWHIVDDPSFPYQSKLFPQISNKGAYHPYTHVYTQQDIADIIEYARIRGIRVVPEFDSPGHTQSWGPGVPDLLTKCYKNNSESERPQPDGTFGPIDPTVPKNYVFLKKLFQEIVSVFPDKYLHLGGDEVDFSCWESNPKIQSFMAKRNYTKFSQLEEFYMQNLVRIVESFPENKTYIVWQEVVDNGVKVNENSLINVWMGQDNFTDEMDKVTQKGYRTLLYSCWYLDMISWGVDWPKYYRCDPHNFNGTEEQKALVLGGGAALWGEFVDSTNVISRLWPRASAPAERLWSHESVNDTEEAAPRMEEHRCRLLQRGFNVEPANGPGYCLVSWD